MPKLNDENRQHRSTRQRVLSAGELSALPQDHIARNRVALAAMAVLLAAVAIFSICFGRYTMPLEQVLASLGELAARIAEGGALRFEDAATSVVVNLRLPRIIAAVLVGAALASAGASYQGVFCNPMVSSDILGASAGAGFGASLAILMGAPGIAIQLAAFCGGMLAVGLTYLIGNAVGGRSTATLSLILAGMVIQALFQAFIGCAKYLADPYSQLPEITFWLMGSLATTNFDDILLIMLPLLVGLGVLIALRWRINVLSLGEEEASALGIDTRRLRLVIIVCATLVTGSAVSVAGQVGWIGLVVPHLARMIVGPNYRHLLPASLLMGGSFLLIVDDVARTVMQAEIPLGILTAVIGAPLFVFLLLKGRRGWS
ncbi:MAG: FecCD family ABC transporter permease [Coriobacteriales bacterium]